MPETARFSSVLCQPWIWLLIAISSAALLYWPGLHGPFLFDDSSHLRLVQSWQHGEISFLQLTTGNGSLIFNRALAMASLAANAVVGGETTFSFKLGNLALHLLCACVAYATLSGLLQRDPNLGHRARAMALIVCTVWLLHPLNVSTVLYVVQRMSQIATLFPLLGVWMYAATRQRMLSGQWSDTTGLGVLLVGIAVCTLLGIQGKQSALVLPGLCLVVELGWFQRPVQWKWPLCLFYGLSVALPAFLALVVVMAKWDWLATAMRDWSMSPWERLLSEPRALWGYIRMLLLPYSPAMGIYTDDFAVSRGWLQPATTLPAWFGLLVVSGLAWRVRRTRPALFVGWFWFLVAHSIEASIVPIELYYEHRNYLPAFGLLLMAVDAIVWLLERLEKFGIRSSRLAPVLLIGCMLALSVQTAMRVQVWKTNLGISLAAMEAHPGSARAYLAFGHAAMQKGLIGDTYTAFQRMATQPDPGVASIGKVELSVLDCFMKREIDPKLLQAAADESPTFLNPVMPYAVGNLVEVRDREGCKGLTPLMLGDAIDRMVDQATGQPEGSQVKWSMRFNAALAYHQGGHWEQALAQSREAWKYSPDPTIALFHVKLLLHTGEQEEAERAFWQVMDRGGYQSLSQLQDVPRTTALRAVRSEIDGYAKRHGSLPLRDR